MNGYRDTDRGAGNSLRDQLTRDAEAFGCDPVAKSQVMPEMIRAHMAEASGCGSSAPNCGSATRHYIDPRWLIDQRIDQLNRQLTQLWALQRSLPAEMNRDAEAALVDLLLKP